LKLSFLQDGADVNNRKMLSSQITENTLHILDKVNWLIKYRGVTVTFTVTVTVTCETTENL
jgi:hypothetical protein